MELLDLGMAIIAHGDLDRFHRSPGSLWGGLSLLTLGFGGNGQARQDVESEGQRDGQDKQSRNRFHNMVNLLGVIRNRAVHTSSVRLSWTPIVPQPAPGLPAGK